MSLCGITLRWGGQGSDNTEILAVGQSIYRGKNKEDNPFEVKVTALLQYFSFSALSSNISVPITEYFVYGQGKESWYLISVI